MSIHDDLMRRIDSLGFVDSEINSPNVEEYSAPVTGKDEYQWYNNQLYTGGDRRLRLSEYESMNMYSEISSALDVYANDAAQKDRDGKILQVYSDNEDLKADLEDLFYRLICVDGMIWTLTRTVCMYGDAFGEIVMQKDRKGVLYVKLLPPKTMWRIEQNGKLSGFIQQIPNGAPVHFAPFYLTHWRLPSSQHSYNPYGCSILEAARKPWRQLTLMEDAMVVYRVTRAPERRVFNIDVGNLPTAAAEQFVEKQRMRFRKRSFINKNGELDYRANTMAPDEDFWLAKRTGSDGTTISPLPGAENLGEIDDVKYFKDKIFAAMKIPRIFLQDPQGQSERRQNVSQQDIAFSRTIERVQNHIVEGFKKIAIVHLMLRGYKKSDLENFEITMTPPSEIRERLSLEIQELRVGVANSSVEWGFPREYIAETIFNTPEREWKELRKKRFLEKMEELKLEAGQWDKNGDNTKPMPQQGEPGAPGAEQSDIPTPEQGLEAQPAAITGAEPIGGEPLLEPLTKSDMHTFEHISHIYSKLLHEGELEDFQDQEEETTFINTAVEFLNEQTKDDE